jgi:MinD superfamily P-loop ATPase
MKELVVISGKGGTGKTSLVASWAALCRQRAVLADCDVDAADLHLVLEPHVEHRQPFLGGGKACIEPGRCTACGKCAELCRFDAVRFDGPGHDRLPQTYRIDALACEGCGVCAHFCDARAIEFAPAVCGQWFVSATRCGPMVHARMQPGAENSGKLVTVIRQQARQIAAERRSDWILCDGSPGIGCPVIASLTGADLALIVVEPTASGLHDFRRVAQLTRQLRVPARLVVNKADLNPGVAAAMEDEAAVAGVASVGRIPYDPAVTQAQLSRQSVVEASHGPAARAIRDVWCAVQEAIRTPPAGKLVSLQVD